MSETLMLTGLQKEILMKGVVGAYPNPDDLWILLAVRMEVQVSAIARGDAYKNKVFALIQDFEAEGRIEEFIRVVVKDKPRSPYLEAIKREFKEIFKVETSSNIKSSFNLTEMELRVLELIHASKEDGATNKEIAYDNGLDLDEVNCAFDDLEAQGLVDLIKGQNFSMDIEKRATINSRGKVFLKSKQSGTYQPNPSSPTSVDRNQLLNLLKGLITAQFNELVYVLNIPDEYLPGQNTPQAERAIALLKWASAPGGIGLNRVQAALNAIINPK